MSGKTKSKKSFTLKQKQCKVDGNDHDVTVTQTSTDASTEET